MNTRFDSHQRSMNRGRSFFMFFFAIVFMAIVAIWVAVGTAVVKTAHCVGDQQCLEQGRSVGAFMKGIQEGQK